MSKCQTKTLIGRQETDKNYLKTNWNVMHPRFSSNFFITIKCLRKLLNARG
jgi:hypothetical protein